MPAASSTPYLPHELLKLQRTVGNAGVSRLLAAQRQAGREEDEGSRHRSSVPEVLRSPGTPLDTALREEMEARLGADFTDVRVHSGASAQRSAAEIQAKAYTSGNHVVIGQSGVDKHTLAHELTHVVQQREGTVAGADRGDGLRVSDPEDRFERAAEANARRVMSGPVPGHRAEPRVPARTGQGAVQRVTEKELVANVLEPMRNRPATCKGKDEGQDEKVSVRHEARFNIGDRAKGDVRYIRFVKAARRST